MSSPVAVVFAANDWAKKPHSGCSHRCPPEHLAARMSGRWCCSVPQSSLPGMTINRSMKFLKGRAAVLVCVGDRKVEDPVGRTPSGSTTSSSRSPRTPRSAINWLNPFPVQLQGTDLLGKTDSVSRASMVGVPEEVRRRSQGTVEGPSIAGGSLAGSRYCTASSLFASVPTATAFMSTVVSVRLAKFVLADRFRASVDRVSLTLQRANPKGTSRLSQIIRGMLGPTHPALQRASAPTHLIALTAPRASRAGSSGSPVSGWSTL